MADTCQSLRLPCNQSWSPILIRVPSILVCYLRTCMQGHKACKSDKGYVLFNFRGKMKPSLLIENLINYRNEDKERCNMLLLMLVVSVISQMVRLTLPRAQS